MNLKQKKKIIRRTDFSFHHVHILFIELSHMNVTSVPSGPPEVVSETDGGVEKTDQHETLQQNT